MKQIISVLNKSSENIYVSISRNQKEIKWAKSKKDKSNKGSASFKGSVKLREKVGKLESAEDSEKVEADASGSSDSTNDTETDYYWTPFIENEVKIQAHKEHLFPIENALENHYLSVKANNEFYTKNELIIDKNFILIGNDFTRTSSYTPVKSGDHILLMHTTAKSVKAGGKICRIFLTNPIETSTLSRGLGYNYAGLGDSAGRHKITKFNDKDNVEIKENDLVGISYHDDNHYVYITNLNYISYPQNTEPWDNQKWKIIKNSSEYNSKGDSICFYDQIRLKNKKWAERMFCGDLKLEKDIVKINNEWACVKKSNDLKNSKLSEQDWIILPSDYLNR